MGVCNRIRKMCHDKTREQSDSDFATVLIDILMTKEVKMMMDDIAKICNLNDNGSVHPTSYYYQGELFSPLTIQSHSPHPIGTIREEHEELAEAAKVWQDKIDFDGQQIIQGLSSILEGCKTLQDIRDRIPDELAMVIPDLRSLSRNEEELFFSEDSPQLVENYNRAKELIIYYVGNRLLM